MKISLLHNKLYSRFHSQTAWGFGGLFCYDNIDLNILIVFINFLDDCLEFNGCEISNCVHHTIKIPLDTECELFQDKDGLEYISLILNGEFVYFYLWERVSFNFSSIIQLRDKKKKFQRSS